MSDFELCSDSFVRAMQPRIHKDSMMEMEWSDSDPDTGNATYAGFDDVDVDVEGVLMLEDFENIPENLEFRNVAHLWTAASAASIHSRTRERKEIDVERDSMPKEECSAKKMLLEPRFDELKLKAVEIDDFDSEGWDSPNESERTELAATPKISKKLPENDIINVLSPTNMVSTENAVPAADVMLTRLKGPSKSGPQLIKPSLNSSTCNISYSAVGEMVFNAALGKWQGNESILDDFDKPTAGPNLIPHTQNISGSVGDMVFDPVKLCWVGNEQDARIFDHISQLETTSIAPRHSAFNLRKPLEQALAMAESKHKLFMGEWYPRVVQSKGVLRDTSRTFLYDIRTL